ncbi:Retroviral ribonuclease H protein [Dioscorea alata]|uniref:Retroviral ribonuclease H protein n=1 Tax=Dioscorea alata TaxID=55571 RepID=A0ACB7WPP8_DIOAL|nr:Retroviral ribonuclease H protein [Dioscorea alata]
MRFLGGDRDPHGGPRRSHGEGRGGRRLGARIGHRSSFSLPRPPKESSPRNIAPPQENFPLLNKNSPVKDGVSYSDVVRTSPPSAAAPSSSGATSLKHRRSPENDVSCKRCLRPGHSVDECRHQLTCRRCSGVGHYAARCPLKPSTHFPPEKPAPRKSKSPLFVQKPLLHVHAPRPKPESNSLRVSLPITEAIIQSKEDLRRRVIIKVTAGNASVRSLHDALPKRLNSDQCENITPFGDDFILTLFSAKAASSIVKLHSLSLETKHGPCSLKFSHWTPEFGSHAVAAGIYNWIRISNLPLHCWNWDSIVSVLKPLGDLIFVRKCEDTSLEHMKALVRLKSSTPFPIDMTVDVGVRSFNVRLEDDGAPIIRSKVIRGSVPSSNAQANSKNRVSPSTLPLQPQILTSVNPGRLTREEKGKAPLPSSRSAEPLGAAAASLSEPALPSKPLSLNSDDQPTPEVGRSSDVPCTVAPRIPPISCARTGEGDALCMHRNVIAERTTAVVMPRDQLSVNSLGSMPLSTLPRDSDSDSLNNSTLIHSRPRAANQEIMPCDENLIIEPSVPCDLIIPDQSINASINELLPRDGNSILIKQLDPT